MRKLLLILLIIFAVVINSAFALTLVSDPYGPCGDTGLTACPVKAEIFENGVSIATDVTLELDLSINYDIGSPSVGKHEYTAVYYDALGRASDLSEPYVLLIPQFQGMQVQGFKNN